MANLDPVPSTCTGCFCCLRSPSNLTISEEPNPNPTKRNFRSLLRHFQGKTPSASSSSSSSSKDEATDPAKHLVFMVNGMVGSHEQIEEILLMVDYIMFPLSLPLLDLSSASDWKFAAKHFKSRFGSEVLVHCSSCNSSNLTFDGVDVMGRRLVEEVEGIVRDSPSLKSISIVAHSLGGLVARYAIGKVYKPPISLSSSNGSDTETPLEHSSTGTVFGLKPINFITVATPHIGSRGNWQFPLLCGLRFLENAAVVSAHWFVGRTGKHLFLTDGNEKHAPLLQRMVSDCEEGQFISALQAFQCRVAYANANYDSIVGWRTATFRRTHEIPQLRMKPMDNKYPHVIYVEDVLPEGSDIKRQAKDPVEEEIICGLRKLSWRRVDVSFSGTPQMLTAHNTIQVKNNCLHYDGTDVISHMIDNFVL